MAYPNKRSRPITVAGMPFRWIATETGCSWPFTISIRVAPVGISPYAELLFDLAVFCTITPVVIRRAIELGMSLGYRPSEPKTALKLTDEQSRAAYTLPANALGGSAMMTSELSKTNKTDARNG